MPEPRFRKEVGCGENLPQKRKNTSSASGDSTVCTTCQRQDLKQHQNKLPSSVRSGLENALVALCDVWFDEIKPHLVRNNIKLHINGSSAAGGDQRSARALPPAPPQLGAPPSSPILDDCPHLDPGAVPDGPRRPASSASSWPKPPAASSASAGRLRTPLRRPLSPLISVPPTPRDGPQIQTHNCKQERPGIRRKRRRFRAQAQLSWRVPRLCRTHPALSSGTGVAGGPATMSASQLGPPYNNYYRFIVPRRESVMKNKTTQTEPAQRVSRACQSRPGYCTSVSRIAGLRSPVPRGPGPTNRGLRNPPFRSLKRSPSASNRNSSSPGVAHSPLVPPPPVICQLKRSEVAVPQLPPLLQDDLIDIIAASNENRLKLLYSSSERDDHSSFLNLLPNFKPEKTSLKKPAPWR